MQDFYVDMSEYKDDMEKYDIVAAEVFERAAANGANLYEVRNSHPPVTDFNGYSYGLFYTYIGVRGGRTFHYDPTWTGERLTVEEVRKKYPHPDYDVVSPKITPRSMACFNEVAKVIGEDKAEEELQKVLGCDVKHLGLDVDKPLIQAFEWSLTPQGGSFWAETSCDINPYPVEPSVSTQETCSGRTATPVPPDKENVVAGHTDSFKRDIGMYVEVYAELGEERLKDFIVEKIVELCEHKSKGEI